MKSIELALPKDFDKSFVVFKEKGRYFPCPWHYHPEYELVLVLKSSGRRMVGDNIGYFKEGDLVFMGSLLPHVWVNDQKYINGKDENGAEAIVIHFKEDFLGRDFMDLPEMTGFRHFLHLSNRGMVLKGKTRARITTLMKQMVSMNGLQRVASLLVIFDIMASSTEYELLASPAHATDQKESGRLSKIIEYVMRNLDEDITLPKVASMANMGLTTFCNFFKENYRVTFVEYLNSVRIGHACKLLSDNEQNIVEIAYSCGFNTLANFNRQFKKYKNMTPSEYRKMLVAKSTDHGDFLAGNASRYRIKSTIGGIPQASY
jgi:AraC-like DNA-binding protein